MPQQLSLTGPFASFKPQTVGELTGKEDYLVELGATEDAVKLLATLGNEIGTVHQIDPTNGNVTVRLLNSGGKMVFVQSGAIVPGAKFKGVVGGRVTTAVATDRALGIKSNPMTNGAANDKIAAIVQVEKI